MRIAVTYQNEQIFQHFGHTEKFKIYDTECGKITATNIIRTDGQGHGALADFLKEMNVDVLICGGIGEGAQSALSNVGIKLYGGVNGSCDNAVNALLNGNLNYNPDVKCSHGEHECSDEKCANNEHECGNHSCKSGSCNI